jgi:tRNA(Ile)-lysidine synthase
VGPAPAVAATRTAVRAVLEQDGRPVVVACSGGADSLALAAATAFVASRQGVAAGLVTVDHGLQPGSAGRARSVAALGAELGLDPVEIVPVEVGTDGGPEAAARTARYRALQAVATALGADVLLGHTADDQAETVLLNVLRGAASSGLAGMAARRGTVVRPLLDARRADTRALCAALGLPVFDDPMNDDRAFRRVAIRHDVLPYLSALAERDLVPVLARQAEILRSDSEFLDELAVRAWPGREAGGEGRDRQARAASLAALPLPLARRALRQWLGAPPPSLAEIDRVLAVASGDVRATELGGGRAVRRSGGLLVLTVG